MRSKWVIAAAAAVLCMAVTVSCSDKKATEDEKTSVSSEVNSEDEKTSADSESNAEDKATTAGADISDEGETVTADPSVNVVDETATEEGKVPAYKVTEYKYNYFGELLEQTVRVYNKFDDPLSEKTEFSAENYLDRSYEYEYNADGLMLRRLPDGYRNHEYLCTYDGHGELLTYESFSQDNEVEYQFRYENEYGDNGKLSAVKCYDDENGGKLVSTAHYNYDEVGNLSEYRSRPENTSDDATHEYITTYEYDENGNAVRECFHSMKDGEESGLDTKYISTYNSHDLPEKKHVYYGGQLFYTYEYEYEFYD